MDMTIEELQEAFSLMDDWEERYELVIDLGQQLPPMDDALKNEQTRVHGCTSKVWIVPKPANDDILDFFADSDALIVKGLIGILYCTYSGKTKKEALEIDIEKLFSDLGLSEHLSPNRRNGFFAMVGRIQEMAASQ
tara:strand:- start:846 stop:1253 length:408 start_codon:yes stop_codon:yes gene_type:complete